MSVLTDTITAPLCPAPVFVVFFFNDTATTEIYTLSLHDALPIFGRAVSLRVAISPGIRPRRRVARCRRGPGRRARRGSPADRKSTRLNSSHANISYAVFCLKKKKRPPTTGPATLAYPLLHLPLTH